MAALKPDQIHHQHIMVFRPFSRPAATIGAAPDSAQRPGSVHSSEIPPALKTGCLTADHRQHLLSEGFSAVHVDLLIGWGVRSVTETEAHKLGFFAQDDQRGLVSSSGIYFPFAPGFGQLRCDNPPIRKGKPGKYLTQAGKGTQPWNPPNLPPPSVLTEGFKDAAAGTIHGGIPTGAIAGVSHVRKALSKGGGQTILFDADARINPQVLAALVTGADHTGGKIQLVPEIPGEPKAGLCEYFKAGHTADDYAKLIASAYTIKAFLLDLPNHWESAQSSKFGRLLRTVFSLGSRYLSNSELEQLAGVCKSAGKKHKIPASVVNTELNRIKNIKAKRAKIRRAKAAQTASATGLDLTTFGINPDECDPDGESPMVLSALGAMSTAMGDNLRLNRLTDKIEYKGEDINPNYCQIFAAGFIQKDIPDSMARSILGLIANKFSYHPAQEYFEELFEKYGDSTRRLLDQPSARLLKTTNPLYDVFLAKMLTALVARVYEPGCKFDYVLLLQGLQGLMKSSFFEALLPNPTWFSDALGSDVEKPDQQALLAKCVIMEWAEFDRISSAREAASLKAFITRKTDTYRKPYAHASMDHPRQSILVGSVNKAEFLNDSTGDRRYWVIEVTQKIDTAAVIAEREELLAAAISAYKSGETLYLSEADEALSAQNNDQYRIDDPWLAPIEQWLFDGSNTLGKNDDPLADWITVGKILESCLQIEPKHHKKFERERAEKVLKSLGWEKSPSEQVRLSNLTVPQRRAWRKPFTVPDTAPQVALNAFPDPRPAAPSTPIASALPTGDWPVESASIHPTAQFTPTHQLLDGTPVIVERTIGQPAIRVAVRDGSGKARNVKVDEITDLESCGVAA